MLIFLVVTAKSHFQPDMIVYYDLLAKEIVIRTLQQNGTLSANKD
jgi:hypothetical protein